MQRISWNEGVTSQVSYQFTLYVVQSLGGSFCCSLLVHSYEWEGKLSKSYKHWKAKSRQEEGESFKNNYQTFETEAKRPGLIWHGATSTIPAYITNSKRLQHISLILGLMWGNYKDRMSAHGEDPQRILLLHGWAWKRQMGHLEFKF